MPSVDEADYERAALVAERQSQVADAGQTIVLGRLEELKAVVQSAFWVDNSISVDIPAGLVPTVAAWSEVVGLAYLDPALVLLPGSNGLNIRNETLVGQLLSAGYDGSHGHDGGTARVRLGIIESNGNSNGLVRRNHPVFINAPGGTTRVVSVYDCTPTCATTVPSRIARVWSMQVVPN